MTRILPRLNKWPYLRIRIDDGDDPPLKVGSVMGVYRTEEIVFRAAAAGTHSLYAGRLASNPEVAPAKEKSGPAPWTERNALVIQIGIGAVVAGLLIWTVLLLRRGRQD